MKPEQRYRLEFWLKEWAADVEPDDLRALLADYDTLHAQLAEARALDDCPHHGNCSCGIWKGRHEAAMALYDAVRQRDEARAEVERLSEGINRLARGQSEWTKEFQPGGMFEGVLTLGSHISVDGGKCLLARVQWLTERSDRLTKQLSATAAEHGRVVEENVILRRLVWLRHGHDGLYGDDGEMQCGRCMLDFKRQPAEMIERRMYENGLRLLAEQQAALTPAPTGGGPQADASETQQRFLDAAKALEQACKTPASGEGEGR